LRPAKTKSLQDLISKKTFTKIGLVLKVKALSSNPNTAKKKRKKEIQEGAWWVQVESAGRERESASLSQVLLKIMLIYGKGGTR
jgi:hypothetical protein